MNVELSDKFKRAAGVGCRQGSFRFPLTDTAVAIIRKVVGDVEAELDLIYAFHDMPSQTMDQLAAASGFPVEKIERLASSLPGKGSFSINPIPASAIAARIAAIP